VYETLLASGYRADMCADYKEAVRRCLVSAAEIDLIISDASVLGVEGLNTLQQAKGRLTRILLVSGNILCPHVRELRRRLEHQFLQKPFTPTELVRKIENLLTSPVDPFDVRRRTGFLDGPQAKTWPQAAMNQNGMPNRMRKAMLAYMTSGAGLALVSA
jgi:DNA-binding response OmpR family regulator